jgi:hypothetical protein
MPLLPAEMDVVLAIAWPMSQKTREDFIDAVETILATYPVRGSGLAYRVAAQLQRQFFIPPEVEAGPQHFNKRKHPLGEPLHHGKER